MASADDIISKAEAILASAKKLKGTRADRHDLMKQVDLLYLQLEDPMDASENSSRSPACTCQLT